MKKLYYILILLTWFVSGPVWAQEIGPELPPELPPEVEPELVKEYVALDTARVEMYYSQLPYLWRKFSIMEEGVYVDTVKVEDPAVKDTIYALQFNYKKEYITRDTDEVGKYPAELPFEWHNQSLTSNGTYIDTVKSGDITVADTIYTLRLTVKEYVVLPTEYLGKYPTEMPIEWHNRTITASGTYIDTIKNADFAIADTIYTLQLTVKEYVTLPVENVGKYPTEMPIEWHNQTITASGTYIDTIKNADFAIADTVYTLQLTVKEYVHKTTQSVGIYPTQVPYSWRGKAFTQSGTYQDTVKLPSFADKDTIYSLKLTIKEYLEIPKKTDKWCSDNLPYKWRNKKYFVSGTYRDTVKMKNFSVKDTVYTLHLSIGEPFEQLQHFELCPGSFVTYRGRKYTQSCLDTIPLPSSSGCDSLIIVQVVAHPNYLFTQDESLCRGGKFTWEGHLNDTILSKPGIYYDSLTTVNGCDSVYELRLFVGEPDLHKDTVAVCEENLPYLFGGHWLTETGVYFDTIQRGAHKCDSIIRLAFTVLKTQRETKTITFCEGTGVRHNGGEMFYDARTFIDTTLTREGCYRITTTVYTPGPQYKMEDWRRRRPEETNYEWHGQIYTKDGTYQQKLINKDGCDSIWILHLVTEYDVYVDSTMCQGDTLFYKGEIISDNRTFTDTLVSKNGGDSIVHLSFRFLPRYYFIEKTSLCSNEYIPWPGHEHIILHEAGAYFDRYTTQYGCDSIYEIDVTQHKSFSKREFKAVSAYHAVDSLPYIWYDGHNKKHELMFDTLIIDTLGHTPHETAQDFWDGDVWHRALSGGCDSTVSIEFMVVRKYSFDTIPLCPNGYVIVDGRKYTQPGDYEHWLLASRYSLHKDSIHYFHIYEAETYDSEAYDEDTVCSNELPYRWHHRVCYAAGEYADTLQTIFGCDSIIHLHLKVKPAYYKEELYKICAGDSLWIRGKNYTKTGVYYDSLFTKSGCDSVFQITINVVRSYHFDETQHFNQGSSYRWHRDGKPWILTKPGSYTDSCKTVVDGCDSIYHLTLIEDKTYFYTDTQTTCQNELPYHWHDMVIYKTGTYYDSLQTVYGMDSVYELNLTVYPNYMEERRERICPNEAFEINGQLITSSGTYRDTMLTEHGCDSIIVYHINLVPGYLKDEQLHMGPKEQIEWHGHILTQPGVYFDSLKTTEGCDSVFRLTLVADPTYHFYDTVRICRNEIPYRWQGADYYASGDYTRPYFSKFKMDSIHYLNLTVDPIYETTERIDRCMGDFYIWNGKTISKSGIYSDTLLTSLGCDSIAHTIVNYHPSFFEHDTMHLVNGMSVTWHGMELTEAGTYYDSMLTVIGCDSIYCLHLALADTFSMTESRTVCQSELPYLWHGQSIMESGDYADKHRSVLGADSSYYLHFTVAPVYFETYQASLCHGGQINYFGKVIREPGVYNDTLVSVYGCDSVQQLIVNWSEEKHGEQTIQLCYGESYSVNGKTFSQSGVYDDTLRTADGCDSIVRYSVQVMQHYFYDEQKSINPGNEYVWTGHLNDQPLKQEGVYFDSLQSVDGCDSVFRLTLHINPQYLTFTNVDICAGESPYLWRGKYYDESGIYDDTLRTALGCDSIFRLTIQIHDTTMREQYYDFCMGQTIGLGSKTFSTSGIYYDTVVSQYGCPQVTKHVIRFHPEYRITKTVHLSAGEEYDFYGRILTQPGTYTHNIPTGFGCDSMIVLTITFCSPKTETLVNLRLCTGDTVQIGDTVITQPGQYYRTFPSKYGCDSVVHYVVQAYPTYHWTTHATFCINESFRWDGHYNDTILTKPGKYEDSYKTVEGCDSVYTLILEALPSFLHDTTIYRCADEVPYVHNGHEYYTDMEFRDTLRAQNGCDSVCVTHYHLHEHCSDIDYITRCKGDLLVIDGRTIIEDGEYRFQIGGDSIHRFNVLSYPVYDYSLNIGSYCDSVLYEGTTYYARGEGKETFTVDRYLRTIHDCDSIEHVTMTLYQSAKTLEHTQTIYDYASVLFGGQLYNKTGTYVRQYHTVHGCDSTAILHLNVIPTDSTGAMHFYYCYANPDNIEVFGKLYHPAKDTIIFDTTAIPDVGMWIIKKAIVLVTYPFTVNNVQAETEVCATNSIAFDIVLNLTGSYPEKYSLDFLPSELSISPTHQEGPMHGTNTINVIMDGRGLCVNPGTYPYRLTLTAADCHMSDTIIDSSITVRYPSDIMEANWNNVVALTNASHNEGRWQFTPPYNWQVWNESGQDKTALVSPNPGLSYLYSDYLESGDRIVVSLKREGYDYLVPSCEFTFYPVGTDGRVPILVYPTAARKAAPITIEATTNGEYTLYTTSGILVEKGTFSDGKQHVNMPAVSGCYLLQLNPDNNATQIKRIVVY
ncbi:MAG: T9SS type A sorting domain-containing protein [Paludibacteraceae bacterium]|nr:T9SS type A sorting domain-containing protein [Paludibacteraceae bacterium]